MFEFSSKYAWGNVRQLTPARRYSSHAEEKITLPKPIPRGPTDILEVEQLLVSNKTCLKNKILLGTSFHY